MFKANFAFRITNKRSIFDETKKMNINKKCSFMPEEENSFEV